MITGYIIGVPKATTRNLSFCATHSSIVAIIQNYILATSRLRTDANLQLVWPGSSDKLALLTPTILLITTRAVEATSKSVVSDVCGMVE